MSIGSIGVLQIVQIVAGVLTLAAGAAIQTYPRWRNRLPEPKRRQWSEPTRLVLALVLLLAGYHLIVWAITLPGTGVQLPRERWWIWLLAGVGAVSLSVVFDGLESRRDGKSSGRPDDSEGPS